MNGKIKLAGGLFVILLILGGIATWDEWKTKQEKTEGETKNHLADFKPEDVLELDYFSKAATPDQGQELHADDTVKPDGTIEVSAVKKDGIWRLTKPIDVAADAQTIASLIKTITDFAYAKVITAQRDQWAEYGLLEPNRHITLRVGGNTPRTLTVYLGNKAPVGFEAYLRTSSNDNVLMGSQSILPSTSKGLNDFRDKTLLKIDESKLKTLTYLHEGEPAIELTKADGKYTITKPEKLDADSAAIKDFVDELNGIKVSAFLDNPEPGARQLFDKPLITVTWQDESGAATTLKLVTKEGRVLAAFDPSQRVFGLPDEMKAKLKKELVDFRNRRILGPDSLDARTLEVDGQGYKNIEGNWYTTEVAGKFDDKGKFLGPEKDKPAEQSHIRAFMVDLEFAKTDRFIPLDDPIAKGLTAAPLHRLTLRYYDPAKAPVTIDLFTDSSDSGKYLVRRSGAKFVYRVAQPAFNSMNPGKGPSPDGSLNGSDSAPAMDEDGGGLNIAPEEKDNSGLNQSENASKTT